MNEEYWRVQEYMSGTITVEDGCREPTKYGSRGVGPHVGIHYKPANEDGQSTTTDNERRDAAVRIASILNDETVDRTGFVRTGETTGTCLGIKFSAIGPHVDRDPPNCFWWQDESDEAKAMRKCLMDSIVQYKP